MLVFLKRNSLTISVSASTLFQRRRNEVVGLGLGVLVSEGGLIRETSDINFVVERI